MTELNLSSLEPVNVAELDTSSLQPVDSTDVLKANNIVSNRLNYLPKEEKKILQSSIDFDTFISNEFYKNKYGVNQPEESLIAQRELDYGEGATVEYANKENAKVKEYEGHGFNITKNDVKQFMGTLVDFTGDTADAIYDKTSELILGESRITNFLYEKGVLPKFRAIEDPENKQRLLEAGTRQARKVGEFIKSIKPESWQAAQDFNRQRLSEDQAEFIETGKIALIDSAPLMVAGMVNRPALLVSAYGSMRNQMIEALEPIVGLENADYYADLNGFFGGAIETAESLGRLKELFGVKGQLTRPIKQALKRAGVNLGEELGQDLVFKVVYNDAIREHNKKTGENLPLESITDIDGKTVEASLSISLILNALGISGKFIGDRLSKITPETSPYTLGDANRLNDLTKEEKETTVSNNDLIANDSKGQDIMRAMIEKPNVDTVKAYNDYVYKGIGKEVLEKIDTEFNEDKVNNPNTSLSEIVEDARASLDSVETVQQVTPTETVAPIKIPTEEISNAKLKMIKKGTISDTPLYEYKVRDVSLYVTRISEGDMAGRGWYLTDKDGNLEQILKPRGGFAGRKIPIAETKKDLIPELQKRISKKLEEQARTQEVIPTETTLTEGDAPTSTEDAAQIDTVVDKQIEAQRRGERLPPITFGEPVEGQKTKNVVFPNGQLGVIPVNATKENFENIDINELQKFAFEKLNIDMETLTTKDKIINKILEIINKLVEVSDEVQRLAGKGLRIFTSLTTRIAEISPALARAVRRANQQITLLTNQRLGECQEFLDSAREYVEKNPELANQVKAEMLNGDYEALKRRGIKGTDKVKDVMDLIAQQLELDNRVKNYFPRRIKDLKKLAEFFNKKPTNKMQEAINDFEKKEGRKATESERLAIISNYLQGKNREGYSFKQSRTIDKVTPDMVDLYADPFNHLEQYIFVTSKVIIKNKIYGTPLTIENEAGEIEIAELSQDNIIKIINDILGEGKVAPDKMKELINLMKTELDFERTRTNARELDKFNNLYRRLVAFKYVTGIKTIALQFSDIFVAIAETSLRDVLSVTVARKFANQFGEGIKITLEDIGIDKLDVELLDQKNIDWKFLKVKIGGKTYTVEELAFLGLTKTDMLNKKILIESTANKYFRLAKSNPARLRRILMRKFNDGEYVDKLIEDLKTGKLTAEVKFALYAQIADFHPISYSENVSLYLRQPLLRPLFFLKSFAFKRYDRLYREALKPMMDGYNQLTEAINNGTLNEETSKAAGLEFGYGIAKLAQFYAFAIGGETLIEKAYIEIMQALGYAPEELPEDESFANMYIDNMTQIFPFINTYQLKRLVETKDYESYADKIISLPDPAGSGLLKDFTAYILREETDFKNTKSEIPIFGAILKGQIEKETEFEDMFKRQKQLDREAERQKTRKFFGLREADM